MNVNYNKSLLRQAISKRQYPEKLYKYRSIKQAREIIDNNSFWFSKPDSFNDPFDCCLSEKLEPSFDDARVHFKNLGASDAVINKSIGMLQRPPGSLARLIQEVKDGSIGSKGVLALSEKFDNILMWSHYGDCHKGVVFGLEMAQDLEFFLMPIKVRYVDEYEELNYLVDPQKSIIDTIGIKALQWSYENEIRIYKNKIGLRAINKVAIKDVYFGVSANQEDIEGIRQAFLEKQWTGVNFYKGRKAHASFKIDFEKF